LALSAAYVGLFQFFAVLVRHATIAALAYAFFVETIVGNMPGMAQRMAISSYARAWIFESAEAAGRPFAARGIYSPVAAETAMLVLSVVALGAPLLAAALFSRREYRDGGS
jgi:ABC-2 type transport system permease protein